MAEAALISDPRERGRSRDPETGQYSGGSESESRESKAVHHMRQLVKSCKVDVVKA